MSSFVKSPAFTPSIVSNLLPCLNVIQQLGTEGHERLAIEEGTLTTTSKPKTCWQRFLALLFGVPQKVNYRNVAAFTSAFFEKNAAQFDRLNTADELQQWRDALVKLQGRFARVPETNNMLQSRIDQIGGAQKRLLVAESNGLKQEATVLKNSATKIKADAEEKFKAAVQQSNAMIDLARATAKKETEEMRNETESKARWAQEQLQSLDLKVKDTEAKCRQLEQKTQETAQRILDEAKAEREKAAKDIKECKERIVAHAQAEAFKITGGTEERLKELETEIEKAKGTLVATQLSIDEVQKTHRGLIEERETLRQKLHDQAILAHPRHTRGYGEKLKDTKTHDAVILCKNGEEITLHSIFLIETHYLADRVRSNWLEAKKKHPCKDGVERQPIDLSDYSAEVVHLFVTYCYAREPFSEISPKLAPELMALANQILDVELREICEALIISETKDLDSALPWIEDDQYTLLHKHVTQIVHKNLDQLLTSDQISKLPPEMIQEIFASDELNMSELELFEVLKKWALSRKEGNIDAAKALLNGNSQKDQKQEMEAPSLEGAYNYWSLIRFEHISLKELVKKEIQEWMEPAYAVKWMQYHNGISLEQCGLELNAPRLDRSSGWRMEIKEDRYEFKFKMSLDELQITCIEKKHLLISSMFEMGNGGSYYITMEPLEGDGPESGVNILMNGLLNSKASGDTLVTPSCGVGITFPHKNQAYPPTGLEQTFVVDTKGREEGQSIAIPIISLKLSQIGRKTDDNGVFEFSLILVPYSKT